MQPITLEDFKKMLSRHDWFYNFSDDHRVYTAGLDAENRINRIIATSGPEYRQAHDEFIKANFPENPKKLY